MVQKNSVILRARHRQPHTSILKVSKSGKSLKASHFPTNKSACLMLQASIQIPFMTVIIKRIPEHIAPEHRTDMITVITGQIHASRQIQNIGSITKIGIQHEIIIRQSLLGYEVTLIISHSVNHRISHKILRERLPCLIVLIEAVTTGIIECRAPCKLVRKGVGIVQLKVMLSIVICFIIIIMHIAELVVVLSGRIISAVNLVHFRTYTLPCDSRVLRSHEPCKTQRVTFVHPSQHRHRRMYICKSITDVSISQTT